MTSTTRRRLLIAGLWPLFGVLSGVQVQIGMLSHHHSWAAVLFFQALVWSLWIPTTWAIGALLRRVPLRRLRPLPVLIHGATAVVIGALHSAAWVAAELILVPFGPRN